MTALAEVAERTDAWWTSCADTALAELIRRGLPFTAADMTDLGVPEPDVQQRWGSYLAAAKARGDIIPAGFVISRRPSRNSGYCRSWLGIPRQTA